MNINPGELNKKIKIILFEESDDDFGEKKEVTIREPRAKVNRIKVTEVMKSDREMELTRCRFLVRYTPVAITNKMFVVYQGIYYQIEYTNNYNDSNEYIEIMAKAGT